MVVMGTDCMNILFLVFATNQGGTPVDAGPRADGNHTIQIITSTRDVPSCKIELVEFVCVSGDDVVID